MSIMKTTVWKGGRIFYGWWVVLAAVVGLSLSIAPVFSFTLGVFIKPLSQEFNWSRAEISLGYALCTLMGAGAMPIVGRMVDRYGARTVVVPSLLIFGLCLASFYFLSARLWHLYLIFIAIGIASSGSTPLPYSRVISLWFDRKRGLALGLSMAGVGLGAFVLPSLAQALVTAVGWRAAYVFLGLLVIVIGVPIIGLLLKETPEMLGLQPDGDAIPPAEGAKPRSQPVGLSRREAWHTSTFWLMTVAFFLVATTTNGCVVHLAPLLTDRGVSAESAAFATSLFGGALLLGRVWAGHLLDRFFAPYVAMGFFLAPALGLVLLWGGATGSGAFVAAFLVGMGLGAEVDMIAYFVGRYFGLLAFGEIYGYLFAAFAIGGGLGPFLMGSGFDATGSYSLVLGTFAVMTLIASGLMPQLGPYRIWESKETGNEAGHRVQVG